MPFAGSVALAALTVLLAGAVGFGETAPLLPPGRHRMERLGWGMFLGLAGVAAAAALTLIPGSAWGRPMALILAAALLAVAWLFRLPRQPDAPGEAGVVGVVGAILAVALAAGVALYLLRAMTEPMWSNDYLAIWGLKGKTIFRSGGLPDWPFRSADAGFSHPEYPIGLPLLYAGFSRLLGRWDDHAMALLFPVFQAATLAVLFGWLRRRGARAPIPLAAAAVLSLFEPLYSAFLTGMAEVPLSGALLLLATSWSDSLDASDAGAVRRLSVASLLASAVKNEGLFFAVAAGGLAGLGIAGRVAGRRRAIVAAACLAPPLAVYAVHRAIFGAAHVRDFDPGLLRAARLPELAARGLTALATEWEVAIRPAWPGLLCVAAILAAGRRFPSADRILTLSAVALSAYLLLPVLAVRGPAWLVRTTLPRTAAALAPVIAAGLALRLAGPRLAEARSRAGESSGDAADRAASGPRAGEPTPSIPAS
jgi:hypothetical protein